MLVNFEPNEVLRLIEKERVTIFNLVPTMAAMLLPARIRAARSQLDQSDRIRGIDAA